MAAQGSLRAMMQPHPHSRQSPPWRKVEDYDLEARGKSKKFYAAQYLVLHLIQKSVEEN